MAKSLLYLIGFASYMIPAIFLGEFVYLIVIELIGLSYSTIFFFISLFLSIAAGGYAWNTIDDMLNKQHGEGKGKLK